MNINYCYKPFPYVIIYNHFDNFELELIKSEIKSLQSSSHLNNFAATDEHHTKLLKKYNVDSFMMDDIYNGRRNQSAILNCITKIYHMTNSGKLNAKKFRFLEYVIDSNADNTMLHGYKNGSSYYEHHDKAVLTFVYTFWEEPKSFEGGELTFTNYDFKPKIKSNSCLIFPSYEKHLVTPVQSNQNGIVRWVLNQRIWIRN